MANFKYFLTYHSIERFQERFPEITKDFPKIKSWSRIKGVDSVKDFFDKLIEDAEENKAYLNNTSYMINLYEKYGYDTEYKFMENINNGILFVMAKERNEKNFRMVTLMPTEFRKKHSLSNIKYSDKEKKEDKKNKKILEMYEDFKKTTYSFENETLSVFERIESLENQERFNILHKDSLLSIIKAIDAKNYYKILNGSRIFMSKNFKYEYEKENETFIVKNISELNDLERKETVKNITSINLITKNFYKSKIIETINKNVDKREFNHQGKVYIYLYDKKTDGIKLLSTYKTKETSDVIPNNYIAEIKEKVRNNHMYKTEIIDSNNWKGKIQIDEHTISFKINENNQEIEIEKIENLIPDNHDKKDLEMIIIDLMSKNKSEIIETISSNQKVRKVIVDDKEYKFLYISKLKEFIFLEKNEVELELANNLYQQNDYSSEKYKELTKTLTTEEERFLKILSGDDNTIKSELSKRKKIHQVDYQGYHYEFLIHKSDKSGYLLTLIEKEKLQPKLKM